MTKTEGNGLGQEKGEVMSITLYRLKGGKDFCFWASFLLRGDD